MIPEKTIEELITRHSSLEKDLASGKVDKKLFAEKSKEYSDLNEIINESNKNNPLIGKAEGKKNTPIKNRLFPSSN